MQMPGRTFSSASYRYGFNGKENDNDVKGNGNQQDYGMRIYDPRLGKFLSVDPLSSKYAMLTPFQFASNTPIQAIDLDGTEAFLKTVDFDKSGKATSVAITFCTDLKPLSQNMMYVQSVHPGKNSVFTYEPLGPLDFTNKDYGYYNKRGYKNFVVKQNENHPFNNRANEHLSLWNEFMTGLGAENSVIIGGKMLDDIKQMPSVKELTFQLSIKLGIAGRYSPGDSESGIHKMTYAEGATDIWFPAILGGKDLASTQHFLGSYQLNVQVLDDGKTGLFTLSDGKTLESLTDHQNPGNSINRKGITPFGSTNQRYIWTQQLPSIKTPPDPSRSPQENTSTKKINLPEQ